MDLGADFSQKYQKKFNYRLTKLGDSYTLPNVMFDPTHNQTMSQKPVPGLCG